MEATEENREEGVKMDGQEGRFPESRMRFEDLRSRIVVPPDEIIRTRDQSGIVVERPYSESSRAQQRKYHRLLIRREQFALKRKEEGSKRKERKRKRHAERMLEKEVRKEATSADDVNKELKVITRLLPKARKARADRYKILPGPTIVLDCQFDKFHLEKEFSSLDSQIRECYAENRRQIDALVPFVITSVSTLLRERLAKHNFASWKGVELKEENFVDLYDREKLVYLTADSPNVIHDLDPSKVYVIGGMIDHNRQKGYCLDLAKKLNISHAQLPIGEFVEMSQRKVLAINHVFEILHRFVISPDWKAAFYAAIPSRKIAKTELNDT